jgi:hypothetical protein
MIRVREIETQMEFLRSTRILGHIVFLVSSLKELPS